MDATRPATIARGVYAAPIVCIDDLEEAKPTVKVLSEGTCDAPENDITKEALTLKSSSADPETLLFELTQTNAITTFAFNFSLLDEDKIGGETSDILTATSNKGQRVVVVGLCSDPFAPLGQCSDWEVATGKNPVKEAVENGKYQDLGTFGEGPKYTIFVRSRSGTRVGTASIHLFLTAAVISILARWRARRLSGANW